MILPTYLYLPSYLYYISSQYFIAIKLVFAGDQQTRCTANTTVAPVAIFFNNNFVLYYIIRYAIRGLRALRPRCINIKYAYIVLYFSIKSSSSFFDVYNIRIREHRSTQRFLYCIIIVETIASARSHRSRWSSFVAPVSVPTYPPAHLYIIIYITDTILYNN